MEAGAPSALALATEAQLLTEALWRPGLAPGAAQLLVSSVEALSGRGDGESRRGADTTRLGDVAAAPTPFASPPPAALQPRFDHASPAVRFRSAQARCAALGCRIIRALAPMTMQRAVVR